ncbi:MAG TPA: iron chelate uptake ABC transporter family permease subunit, partial [Deinococcales bacterium]|nr:iron chelate uptake ABC transporter family permease subunit [Deinococcales bacterium]
MTAAGVLLVAVALVASGVGALSLPPGTTLAAAWHALTGQPTPGLEGIAANLRFPRVALAALTGAALGASGAALQGVFRNPLADPYLLGAASGAVFGVTLAIAVTGGLGSAYATAVFAPGAGVGLLPLAAFAGALGAVLLAAWLARGRGSGSLVLAGVVVGSILTALSTFVMLRDADRLRAVFSWTLGNLTLAGWADVWHAAPYVLISLVGLMLLARPLDALQLGEDTAGTLGLRVSRLRLLIVAAASLATAAVV